MSEIKKCYEKLVSRVSKGRKLLGRSLTLAEKILIGHMPSIDNEDVSSLKRKESYVGLRPDRVAMQDATAQMALLQFMHAGLDKVAVPTTVHCDHLIEANVGAKNDLLKAKSDNEEIYDFLKSVSSNYGITFWEPGSGIIHQVVLENYAFPGGMMIGTDSHTPNAGGLGMIAIGIGGADAVDVIADQDFGLLWPGIIGVKLTGQLQGFATPKDIILKLMDILTVKGGTSHIIEFFGSGAQTISATGKGTICNMGAEHGATTSIFPLDLHMLDYLKASGRKDVADLAEEYKELLCADPEVLEYPEKFYDRVIEIDLSTLQSFVVGPHSPDLVRPIEQLAQDAKDNNYPTDIRYALIGSCTNSSYEDIGKVVDLISQALKVGLKPKIPLFITPGSSRIYETIQESGYMDILEEADVTVLANACGPCIGQWRRNDIKEGETNTIISSYNRNFRGRNDQNQETLSFLASPELVVAMAFSGDLRFNPLTDTLKTQDEKEFKFSSPKADMLPKDGFVNNTKGCVEPSFEKVKIYIDPNSKRLQLLERFDSWDGEDYNDLFVLLKSKGKCTTDHISAAGPWLYFRGHLNNISDNLFRGAVNAFTSKTGLGKNQLTQDKDVHFHSIARYYKNKNRGWVVFADENYGEGSSREHAAMEPRYLNGKSIIAKSFARIAETNLKKQGVLPLTFVDKKNYDQVREDDLISICGLDELTPNRNLIVVLKHKDHSKDTFEVKHSLTKEQINWFKVGSALNYIAENKK